MDRRDFVLMGAAALSLGGCAGVRYISPPREDGRLVVPASALATAGELFLQSPGMQRPVYLRRVASGETVAVLASCTHQGCQPEPVGDRLACPCHGSEFSFEGTVLQGPAERPLTRYDVTERDGTLIVWLEGPPAR